MRSAPGLSCNLSQRNTSENSIKSTQLAFIPSSFVDLRKLNMGDDLPEASNLVSSDVQAPISGRCEDEDQDEAEMLRRTIDLSLTNDDASVCEPRPESNLENYQYSPLPSNDRTIRLLCIPPADDISDTLVCDMRHVRLIDKPEYAALSYTWGAPVFDHHVICNGRRLAITAHLDAALRRFRKTTWWMLWVDALCIDQTNIPERSYQVSIMKHIYSQASVTFVYLGESSPRDLEALKLMLCLTHSAQLVQKIKADAASARTPDTAIQSIKLSDLPHTQHPAWEAMQSLFSRPWFSRMWIIQEVVLSSRVVMILGEYSMPWELVTESIRAYYGLQLAHSTWAQCEKVMQRFLKYCETVSTIMTVKTDFQSRSLFNLLKSFRCCYSSDPRDKVYALLGLANDQMLHQVVSVDYSKSVEAVYLQCAQFLVRNGCGMEMLIEAGSYQEREDTDPKPSLPSWIPDWSREYSVHFRGYRAAGQTQSDIELEDGGNGLNAKGIRIDVIDALAPPLGWRAANPNDIICWEQKVREMAQQSCFFSEERVGYYANVIGAGFRADVDGYNSVDGLLEFFWNRRLPESFKSYGGLKVYGTHVGIGAAHHKVCITRRGYMGRVPLSSQPGDIIVVLYGGRLPFTVRKTDGKYLLLGAGYLEGFMNGEALKLEDAEPEVFVLE